MTDFDWIVNESNLPWLKLDIEFNHETMLKEAIALKDRFVKHRDQDGVGGYRHKGWRSLAIHGISAEKTNHFEQYGYKSNKKRAIEISKSIKNSRVKEYLTGKIIYQN